MASTNDDALMTAFAPPHTATKPSAATDETPAPPFVVGHPESLAAPVVFASPHSGRIYPSRFTAAARLSPHALRRSEDAHVDALFAHVPAMGAPLLAATYARAYVDLNRAPYDLDPGMFDEALPAFACGGRDRAAVGLGSIARIVAEGQEIYHGPLRFTEVQARLEAVHRPYHAEQDRLLDAARSLFGASLLIDCHSMPSAAAASSNEAGRDAQRAAPQIVLGDRYSGACAPLVTATAERVLTHAGYRVARNRPYAGGFSTRRHGRPAQGRHALQIEISRGLYLDEATLEPREGFERLQTALDALARALIALDPAILHAGAKPALAPNERRR